jgi:hypothetical protein
MRKSRLYFLLIASAFCQGTDGKLLENRKTPEILGFRHKKRIAGCR